MNRSKDPGRKVGLTKPTTPFHPYIVYSSFFIVAFLSRELLGTEICLGNLTEHI